MRIRQGYLFSFEDALKFEPRSRLRIILDALDLDDVIDKLSHKTNVGPSGYSVYAKLCSLIAMRVYNMKTFTELVERLTVDPRFRYDCGFDPFGRVPSIATFSRFYNQVAALVFWMTCLASWYIQPKR